MMTAPETAETLEAATMPAASLPRRRVASLTAGQTPRTDVLPEILANLPIAVEIEEFGALDGLSDAEIADLAPRPDEYCLVTRLKDGRNVVVSKPRVTERLEEICRGLDHHRFDLVVILSTGLFRDFDSLCPTVNAQRALEASIAAMAGSDQVIGVIQPLRAQVAENAMADYWTPDLSLRFSYAESGNPIALADAATDLDSCDLLVLNSVGYTEADRKLVAERAGRPVVLARRIVTGAIRLLLDPGGMRMPAQASVPQRIETMPTSFAGDSAAAERIAKLTQRERQVMSLVAEGLSNKAIGRQLGISPRTVEIHRAKMMDKMGAQSVGALIRMVLAAQHADL